MLPTQQRRPAAGSPGEDADAERLLMRPTTPESVDWMALQLVRGGAVAKCRGAYLDGEWPLPRFLLPELLFDALLAEGLLTVAEPDLDGRARLSLTDTGHAFYRQLYTQRQLAAETDALPPQDPRPVSDELGRTGPHRSELPGQRVGRCSPTPEPTVSSGSAR